MPKETFYNLPDEKRESFISAALDEFARNPYKSASVSKIVEHLGIAKGSVYQYFDHKMDLYTFLVTYASEKKLAAIGQHLQGRGLEFFDFFNESLYEGAVFDFGHPSMALIIMQAMRETFSLELTQKAASFFRPYIDEAQAEGSVRTDIPPLSIAHMCIGLASSLKGYLEENYQFSTVDLLLRQDVELPFTLHQLRMAVEDITKLVRNGLQAY